MHSTFEMFIYHNYDIIIRGLDSSIINVLVKWRSNFKPVKTLKYRMSNCVSWLGVTGRVCGGYELRSCWTVLERHVQDQRQTQRLPITQTCRFSRGGIYHSSAPECQERPVQPLRWVRRTVLPSCLRASDHNTTRCRTSYYCLWIRQAECLGERLYSNYVSCFFESVTELYRPPLRNILGCLCKSYVHCCVYVILWRKDY